MVKVSVIVPVYNGEKYIKACMDSILAQTLKEIEIVIIDDGSKDNTGQMLKDYATKYPTLIKVITKDNEGQGKARNVGIDIAKGEFLTFVDADDTIEACMLEKMYITAKKENCDVVVSDYAEITKESKVVKKSILAINSDIKRNYIISCAGPWNKLIRTELLTKNNLYFLEKGIYEDIAMIPLVAIYANNITYIEEPLYHYYIRKGSSMRQTEFNQKLLSIYPVLENLEKGFEISRTLRKI